MGLKPNEVKSLYLRDFNLMLTGHYKRQEQQWNHTRHIMTYVLNYGGMGLAEPFKPQDIWPLHMDKEDEKRMITTMQQAMDLLKQFEAD